MRLSNALMSDIHPSLALELDGRENDLLAKGERRLTLKEAEGLFDTLLAYGVGEDKLITAYAMVLEAQERQERLESDRYRNLGRRAIQSHNRLIRRLPGVGHGMRDE